MAGNLTAGRVAMVRMHEQMMVHGGLRGIMGEKGSKQLLNRLFVMLGGKGNEELRSLAEEYKLNLDTKEGQQEAVEEYLAHNAERENLAPEELKPWQRVVRHIRETLEKLWARIASKMPIACGRQMKAELADLEVKQLMRALKQHLREGSGRRQARREGTGSTESELVRARRRLRRGCRNRPSTRCASNTKARNSG